MTTLTESLQNLAEIIPKHLAVAPEGYEPVVKAWYRERIELCFERAEMDDEWMAQLFEMLGVAP